MRLRKTALFAYLLMLAALAGSKAAVADDSDRISFGSRIVVNEGETVNDVVCFLCSVEAHGKINGDVVTFLGSVKTDKPIQGDVVAFAGNVVLSEDASVGGDLVVFGGTVRKSADVHIGSDQVVFPAVIFGIPILILGGLIWGISALFRRRSPVYYVPPAR